ncbi:MAG: RtcB family protein [Clostridia bacterium]|nr:RtcB family protein [Clostridia bacterium]
MIEIDGKYNTALVFTDELEEAARAQIQALCSQAFCEGSKIRIMPDVHAGAGCTIGTTMTIGDKVCPNLVGVDIGCGMETVRLAARRLELARLDKVIRERIPSGFSVRDTPHAMAGEIDLSGLRWQKGINLERAYRSIGTLGGGNHFIEVGQGENGALYLVVHSGSRHMGLEIAKAYQGAAYDQLDQRPVPRDLAYVSGPLLDDYLHDMAIAQHFAALNRRAMVREILKAMKVDAVEQFTTVHNYIDIGEGVLRKGAVSAKAGERLLIPINMRDGSLICVGKGNPDWNQSAPHGAGRLMSRSEAKRSFTVSEFKKQMRDIYTTSVGADTLDECPMAYKSMDAILNHIGPAAEVMEIVRPIYNFKAGE